MSDEKKNPIPAGADDATEDIIPEKKIKAADTVHTAPAGGDALFIPEAPAEAQPKSDRRFIKTGEAEYVSVHGARSDDATDVEKYTDRLDAAPAPAAAPADAPEKADTYDTVHAPTPGGRMIAAEAKPEAAPAAQQTDDAPEQLTMQGMHPDDRTRRIDLGPKAPQEEGEKDPTKHFDIQGARLREIADEVGAYLMVDMAHIAGLVAAGVHPNPVPYCEFVTTTTHKTLRGPRGGLILCREEFAKAIDKASFPGTQGGPLMHTIAAKAVCFGEALKPEFKEYGAKVVSNCKALAEGLLKRGCKLVSGGTDNHVMLLDLRDTDVTGKELEARLDDCYITVNKNTIPGEPRSPFVTSGVRIGTAAVTTRGLNEEDMDLIAEYITLVLNDYENSKEKVRAGVEAICKKYPLYE